MGLKLGRIRVNIKHGRYPSIKKRPPVEEVMPIIESPPPAEFFESLAESSELPPFPES